MTVPETPKEAADAVSTGMVKKSRDSLGNETEYLTPEEIRAGDNHDQAARKPLRGVRMTHWRAPGTG